MRIAVIGGGAAGFFAAIQAAGNYPEAQVILLEKGQKFLSKVRISGGGRCNVTNGCASTKALLAGYPRGSQLLKKLFREFDHHDTVRWFTERGVSLKTEADLRVFPTTDQSQTIIHCLAQEAKSRNIQLLTGANVRRLEPKETDWELQLGRDAPIRADRIIVATGGSPSRRGLNWLEALGHEVTEPVPSLFTFNMPEEDITGLPGVSVSHAIASIAGHKLQAEGPLLITHWGMSGPAILKLSSLGARQLAELGYDFTVRINWIAQPNQEVARQQLSEQLAANPAKQLRNFRPFSLPERLWHYLLLRANLPLEKPSRDLGKKQLNKLTQLLTQDSYAVKGKTTFKEEFVTCGGVSLQSIHSHSLQSKACPGLYFAGEVLDIDGITGGYNFQAAWTTGYIAGQLRE